MKKTFESELERLTIKLISIEAGKINKKIYSTRFKIKRNFSVIFYEEVQPVYSQILQLFKEYKIKPNEKSMKEYSMSFLEKEIKMTDSKAHKILYDRIESGKYKFKLK